MAYVFKCEVCEKPTERKCGKCWNAYYCNQEHQAIMWKNHKKNCRPFKICSNEELGRHVIATKPIKEGDVILQDLPLMSGPHRSSSPICMGCLNSLYKKPIYQCQKCGWPLCSQECQNNPNHIPECYYTLKWGKKLSMAHCKSSHKFCAAVLMLRVLFLKIFQPNVWKTINNLESHCHKSKNSGFYETSTQHALVNFYNAFGRNGDFDEEEIRKVSRIIEINGFCVPCTKPSHVSIYKTASLFEHNCKGNCYTTFNSKGMLRVIAGVPIKEGEHLSICYINAFWPTFKRQRCLQYSKLFTCYCERCLDSTEFGTNFSALKCTIDKCEGVLLPQSFLVRESQWNCNNCDYKITEDTAAHRLLLVSKFLKLPRSTDATATTCSKELLRNKWFPKYAYVKINAQLINKIGNQRGFEKASNEDVELKITMCREMIELSRIIAPAEKLAIADILYHLQNALSEMCRRKRADKTLSDQDYVSILKERLLILHEIIKGIKYEYSCRTQFEVAKAALKMIEDLLAKLDK